MKTETDDLFRCSSIDRNRTLHPSSASIVFRHGSTRQCIGAQVLGFQSIRFVCVADVDAVRVADLLDFLVQTRAESSKCVTKTRADSGKDEGSVAQHR